METFTENLNLFQEPLELDFAMLTINKWRDFYELNKCHRLYDNNAESNNVPCFSWSPQEEWWDHDLPQDSNLEQMIWDDFGFEWEDWVRNEKEERGLQITTDMNFYNVIAIIPVYSLLATKETIVTSVKSMVNGSIEYDAEEFWYNVDAVKDINEQLINCARQLKRFESFCSGLKGWFKNHVVIQNNEGDFRFVDIDWFYELKAMEPEQEWFNWTKYNSVNEDYEKALTETEEETILEQILIKGKEEGSELARNSLVM